VTPATAQHLCRAQPRWSAAGDDDVIHVASIAACLRTARLLQGDHQSPVWL
jgi:hypothetical protein